ncbi:unnamed protein product [Protopolystoma xenopodis]|uniref:Uncharacterized protein n=1 Tax=Protopolystoma xenopodis TaxID=117903 RepID=A0A448WMZ4_9PLAT|nr:unnamed protein product [Protopolystoma xenopodis]
MSCNQADGLDSRRQINGGRTGWLRLLRASSCVNRPIEAQLFCLSYASVRLSLPVFPGSWGLSSLELVSSGRTSPTGFGSTSRGLGLDSRSRAHLAKRVDNQRPRDLVKQASECEIFYVCVSAGAATYLPAWWTTCLIYSSARMVMQMYCFTEAFFAFVVEALRELDCTMLCNGNLVIF